MASSRHAPAIAFPVGGSAWPGRLLRVLFILWFAVQWLWWQSLDGEVGLGWWTSLALGLAWGGVSLYRVRAQVVGRLVWQPPLRGGEVPGQWLWFSAAYRAGTPVADLEWAWDLQAVVLLRLRNAAGVHWWVWLEQRADPPRWDALRRALSAHRMAA